VGGWGDLGKDIREKFDQDLHALLWVEMVHSLLQGFQRLVDEGLQDCPILTLLFFSGRGKRIGPAYMLW
jgi:hypothetical protein